MNIKNDWNQFRLIIQKSLDGSASSEEIQLLHDNLLRNNEARQFYIDFMMVHGALFLMSEELSPKMKGQDVAVFNKALLDLSEYEKAAPAIDESQEKPERELIQRVVYPPREKRIVSKFSIFFLAMNAAAILLIALFVRFMPERGKSYACVIGQYQAQSQGDKFSFQVGQYLDDNLIKLEKGLLKIQMNDGSEVLLEAPVEVSLENDDQLFLIQGKLTASVPKEAIGFTVRTPSASIIDYGTEFGVKVDRYANTEAHVLKGNIKVGIGSNPRILEETLRLSTNQAACVSGRTLKEIPSETDQFVYGIPSPFERMAKSLGASMYLCLQSDSIGSFRDVMGAVATKDIKIKSDLSVVPGPFLADGVKSYAFRIQGSDSAIEVTNTQSIPQSPEGDYSIGCWIRFNEIRQQAIYSGRVNSKNIGFRLRSLFMKEDGALRHFSHDLVLSGTAWSISNSDALRPGQWYFVVISRDAGDESKKDMYVNGELVASKTADVKDRMIERFDSFQFGGDVGSCGGFEGELAEILMFPKALNSKEVQQLYEAGCIHPNR